MDSMCTFSSSLPINDVRDVGEFNSYISVSSHALQSVEQHLISDDDDQVSENTQRYTFKNWNDNFDTNQTMFSLLH